jgi:hypothetical protein
MLLSAGQHQERHGAATLGEPSAGHLFHPQPDSGLPRHCTRQLRQRLQLHTD